MYSDSAIGKIEYCIGQKYCGNGYAGESLKGEPTLKGYRYKVVVDQFPITDKVVDVLSVHSTHVETVVLMSRKDK